jgi:hypothetical protein
MMAESHRGRVVRKNVMVALSKAEGKQIFSGLPQQTGRAFYDYTP